MNREKQLSQLGIRLPLPGKAEGSYATVQRAGDLVYLSGTGPPREHSASRGTVGTEISLDQAYQAARSAMIALLAALKSFLGTLDGIEKCVSLRVYINSTEGFSEHPRVADGATDLLMEIFEQDELPVRTSVGVNSLPFHIPIELDMVVYAPVKGD